MKKILIGGLLALFAIAEVIGGKIYMDSNNMENIVKSDEVKKITEDTLRKLDEKALTSEGKIKSYKINYNKIKRNPMGGISIEIIINDNDSLRLGTIINKYNKDVGYEFGSLSLSPGLSKLIRGE
ncbi:MAG: DUF1310 family protein [Gemella haemolysans]|uniref:DUF1310 family protein n=1 Tax=Gemella haemolysans TaxID=1379 RepID=UPI00290ADD13|nr:DUF1310 family protein [Gemella haemolysans]MDU6573198.1 DUF1310 family protein [Gemella haemolysans]